MVAFSTDFHLSITAEGDPQKAKESSSSQQAGGRKKCGHSRTDDIMNSREPAFRVAPDIASVVHSLPIDVCDCLVTASQGEIQAASRGRDS